MKPKTEIPTDFKGKLNWLVANINSPDGDCYTDREIGAAIGKTGSYIWRLRHDPKVNNPSLEVAVKLAQLFGVGLSFFEQDPKPEEMLEVFNNLFASQIAKRAPAMNDLSDPDKEALLRIIDHVLSSQRK